VIIQGTFDPDAIRNAAMNGQPTASGRPVTRVQYANNDVYVVGDISFVVVTKETMIAGNETGIRRTLDRIRDKKVRRDVPAWMAELVENPSASIVAIADLSTDPVVRSAAQQMPFLDNLSVVRILGNFEPPGINLAGTLSYPDTVKATSAGASLEGIARLSSFTQLLSLVGIQPPIKNIEVRVEDRDVKFIAAINSRGAAQMIDWWAGTLRR
jgi:membrane-associated protease RseP (regulator of RpoE activity)